jgi:hypothetical protein
MDFEIESMTKLYFSALFVMRDCLHDLNRLLYPSLYILFFTSEERATKVFPALNNQALVRLMPRDDS